MLAPAGCLSVGNSCPKALGMARFMPGADNQQTCRGELRIGTGLTSGLGPAVLLHRAVTPPRVEFNAWEGQGIRPGPSFYRLKLVLPGGTSVQVF